MKMKKHKKMGTFILAVALLATLTGCSATEGINTENGTDSTKEEQMELTEKEFAPTKEYVRLLGRAKEQDNTLWLPLSGTGAEFSFVGTKATITMKADSAINSGIDNQARFAIYVNGERVVDDMVDKIQKSYTVFESEEAQECVIRVVKLSEAAQSTAGIGKIEVTSVGDIQPTEDSQYFIEFIGDSITCGYGVDDEDRDHHFSTRTEDVTKTYAYKTAQALGADYSMVSFSGHGIISGYTDDGTKVEAQQVPPLYSKLGFSYGAYMGKYYPQEVEWDFSTRQPDLIVINLGTNDSSYVKGEAAKEAEYETAYVEFLKEVRAKNPDATILCTLGIMGDELYPSVEKAVAAYKEETGDSNIDCMRFAVQSASDGYAADWHPTEATHTKAAEKLTAKIQEIMGW